MITPLLSENLDPPPRVEEIAMAKMLRERARIEGVANVAVASLESIIKAQREVLLAQGLRGMVPSLRKNAAAERLFELARIPYAERTHAERAELQTLYRTKAWTKRDKE